MQWFLEMERLHAKKEPNDGSIYGAVRKLSAADKFWIGLKYREQPSGERSFRKFTVKLRSVARDSRGHRHLQNVSHVAVWRCCKDLRGKGKETLAEYIIKKAADIKVSEV